MMVPLEITQLLPLMVKHFLEMYQLLLGDALRRGFSLNTPPTMVGDGKGKVFSPNASTGDFFSGVVVWSSVEPS